MNISEGYCRRNLKAYMNHLNILLGPYVELLTCYYSCYRANFIWLLNLYEFWNVK